MVHMGFYEPPAPPRVIEDEDRPYCASCRKVITADGSCACTPAPATELGRLRSLEEAL